MTLPAGARLGAYVVLEPLGEGGMGVVYRARDEASGREVALKTIAPGSLSAPGMFERFEREARALARIVHPNVARLFAAGEERGVAYLVCELVAGTSLDERSRKEGALPWREAVRYAIQIAHALAAVHAKGLVHRDVKPSNILVTLDGTAKLTDFGLVRATAAGDSLAGTLTQAGALLGTVGFMAPEQADGASVGPAADLYSLGATLFMLLTGAPPFAGAPLDVLRLTLRAPPPAPGSRVKGLPRPLDALVVRLLSKTPHERGESAEAVAVELEAIRREHAGRSRRFPLILGLVVAVAVALALVLALALDVPARLVSRGAPAAAPAPILPSRKPVPAADESELPAPLRSLPRTKHSKPIGVAGSYAWRHSQPIEAIAFAPRSRLVLATAGWTEKALRAWTADQGVERWTESLPSPPRALAVSSDERLAVAGGEDGSVTVFDVATGKRLRALPSHASAVSGAAFLPGTTRLVVASVDGTLRGTDASSGSRVFEANAGAAVGALAASPSSAGLFVTALATGELVVRSGTSGDLLGSAPERADGPITCVAYSSDGSRLAAGTETGSLVVLDAASLARSADTRRASSRINAVAFVRDAGHVVTALKEDQTLLWRVDGPPEPPTPCGEEDQHALAVSPDGSIATGGGDRRIHLLGADGAPRAAPGDPLDLDTFPDSLVVLPDGHAVTGGRSGVLHVLEPSKTGGREVGRFPLEHGPLLSLAATSDGGTVYCGMKDGTVLEVLVATGEARSRSKHEYGVRSLALSPDGRELAVGTEVGFVWVFEREPWHLLERHALFPGPNSQVDFVGWSSDGARFLGVTRIGMVFVDGKPATLRGQGTYLTSAACSPDRPLALVTAHEECFYLWDLERNARSGALPCGTELTRCAWLGHRHAAVAAFDGSITIVDVDKSELVDRIDLSGSHDFATALAARGNELTAVTSRGVALRFELDLPR
jgi:WD40 repeat protein